MPKETWQEFQAQLAKDSRDFETILEEENKESRSRIQERKVEAKKEFSERVEELKKEREKAERTRDEKLAAIDQEEKEERLVRTENHKRRREAFEVEKEQRVLAWRGIPEEEIWPVEGAPLFPKIDDQLFKWANTTSDYSVNEAQVRDLSIRSGQPMEFILERMREIKVSLWKPYDHGIDINTFEDE